MKKGAIITRFKMIESKEVFNTVTGKKETFPAQIRMEITNGNKAQVIAFGYTRLGGRSTFLVKKDQTPQQMTLAAFVRRMREAKVQGLEEVLPKISQLKAVYKKDIVVAKCACCGQVNVTAAEVDFVQRFHERLSRQLRREVTPFTPICMACQKAPVPKKEEVAVATCASCESAIKSQRVADYSIQQYGVPLCFGKCQNDAKAGLAAQQESIEEERLSEGASASSVEELVIEETPMAKNRKRIRDEQDAKTKEEIQKALRDLEEEVKEEEAPVNISELKREMDAQDTVNEMKLMNVWTELDKDTAISPEDLPFPEVAEKKAVAPKKEEQVKQTVAEFLGEEPAAEEEAPMTKEEIQKTLEMDAAVMDFLNI